MKKYVKGCVSMKKQKSCGKYVGGDCIKQENSLDFFLDFVQEFGLWTNQYVKLLLTLQMGANALIFTRQSYFFKVIVACQRL